MKNCQNHKQTVLFSAYACEPKAGSEYGVGWNVPLLFSKMYSQYEVYVLTRSRCRKKIEEEMLAHPIANLHFLFYDIPSWLFYKNEMKSNWGEQINYILWQLFVVGFIKKMDKSIHFDLIHHLTFNQYRTPSPGFFLNIPFVMGPIGGAEIIHPSFYQDLAEHSLKKEKIRSKGADRNVFKWLCGKSANKKLILFSSAENINRLSPYCKSSFTKLMPAIAFDPKDFDDVNSFKSSDDRFTLLYAGKALDWKGIHIFLKAAKKAYKDNGINDFLIKLVGIRFENEQNLVKRWVKDLCLEDNIDLIPFMQRDELLSLMKVCSLSVYPAFRDSGSMSVLEASALGCPTICFNVGGQDAFPNNVLLKVPVSDSYDRNMENFANQLKWAYDNRKEASIIGQQAKKYVYESLTWKKRIEDFQAIYNSLLNDKL